jgi:hypothetical protein
MDLVSGLIKPVRVLQRSGNQLALQFATEHCQLDWPLYGPARNHSEVQTVTIPKQLEDAFFAGDKSA